ncbi:hypothetical protein SARC_17878, partial [Sphaeroforma arctica JP610]
TQARSAIMASVCVSLTNCVDTAMSTTVRRWVGMTGTGTAKGTATANVVTNKRPRPTVVR